MLIAAILLAAGSGRRFNDAHLLKTASPCSLPKQYLELGGRPVIRHAAEALRPHVALIQPVGDTEALTNALDGLNVLPPIAGGSERQESVRLGLEALARHETPPDLVLVHDGARPHVPAHIVKDVIAALEHHDGAIPGIRVSDTLKRVRDGVIEATICRANLWRAQTPQGFKFPLLLESHRAHGDSVTDDAALMEAAGYSVALVPGAEDNIKLTLPEDLVRLERLFRTAPLPRTGLGYDVHAFQAGRPLILCGITIPHDRGLAGHSDADVGIHTLCDAIYGALAEGDIGRHFPPSEEAWKDMDSARFLIHAGQRIRARGGMLINADITIICEQPKIGPHAQAMRERLAALLDVEIDRLSVKATTSERLGFTGREEGIAATAVATVLLPS